MQCLCCFVVSIILLLYLLSRLLCIYAPLLFRLSVHYCLIDLALFTNCDLLRACTVLTCYGCRRINDVLTAVNTR